MQVNTDENPQLAARLNIRGIPVVILFREGRETDRMGGAMERSALLAWWKGHVSLK